jgi:hypothetical protein
MSDKLEKMWQGTIVAYLGLLSLQFLTATKKTTKNNVPL